MSDAPINLAECPVGLFTSQSGELCLKTEYGNNEGRIDAYIVSTGEFFWGSAPQTIANQRKQLVTPVTTKPVISDAKDMFGPSLGQPVQSEIGETDFDRLEYKFGCVLGHATGGKLSYTTYTKEVMCQAIDEHISDCVRDAAEEYKTIPVDGLETLADDLHAFCAAAPHSYPGHNIELFERAEKAIRSLATSNTPAVPSGRNKE